MKALQERLRKFAHYIYHELDYDKDADDVRAAADRIDVLEAEVASLVNQVRTELIHKQEQSDRIAALGFQLQVALEAQRCECSSDAACRFAHERDALEADYQAECAELELGQEVVDELREQIRIEKNIGEISDKLYGKLHDENLALKKDAERYQKVRFADCVLTGVPHDLFDKLIDAAIAAEKESL